MKLPPLLLSLGLIAGLASAGDNACPLRPWRLVNPSIETRYPLPPPWPHRPPLQVWFATDVHPAPRRLNPGNDYCLSRRHILFPEKSRIDLVRGSDHSPDGHHRPATRIIVSLSYGTPH